MFILLLAFWILLNGRVTAEIVILGIVVCAAIHSQVLKYGGFTLQGELRMWRRAPRAVAYLFLLTWEVVKACVQVMVLTLSKAEEVKPRLVRVDSPVRTEIGKVILANSITLTPGTITCGESGGQFYIHALDEQFAHGMTDSCFVKAIQKMEDM